jgi:DNA-binding transcriptional regulator of glucitol operon
MSGPEAAVLIGAIVALWVVQIALGYRQAVHVSRRIAELRRRGTVAVGMGRGRLRRRTYAIVAVDPLDRIIQADVLSGWTTVAAVKPLPELTGLSIASADRDPIVVAKDRALQTALRQAFEALRSRHAIRETTEGGTAIAQRS